MFVFILFLCFVTEEITLLQYASNVFYPKHSFQKRVLVITLFYLCMFLVALLRSGILNACLFCAFNAILLYAEYQNRMMTALFHSVVLTSIMGFSEIMIYVVLNYRSPELLSQQGTGVILYAILSKMLFFSIVCLCSFAFKRKKSRPDYYDKIIFLLLLIPLSSVFILLTFIRIIETFQFTFPLDIFVTVSAVFLLAIDVLIFLLNQYHYLKSIEFVDLQLQLQKEEDLAKYYKMILSQNEDQNILIHDIKKHLQSIDQLNGNGHSSEIHDYIQQLLNSSELKVSSRISDNELLNSILCRYQRECDLNSITFGTDIRKDSLSTVSYNDLTSLFCNLLDNAITACKKVSPAFIELSIQKKNHSPFTVIVLVNSCLEAPVYDHDHLPVSTNRSNKRHGYGMKSINKIVEKYNGNIQMYFDDKSAQFHTIIMLKETKQAEL